MYNFKVTMFNGWEVIIPVHAESLMDAWFDATMEALKCSNTLGQMPKSIIMVTRGE